MIDILINSLCTVSVFIPESASTDTVTFKIYRVTAGTTVASGNLSFLAGWNWKTTFTPTALDTYVVEWHNETLDRKGAIEYRVLGEVAEVTPSADFSYDVTTNIGKVRACIGDTNAAAPMLTDTEITAMLALMDGEVFPAAALACNRIAASKALLAKKITSGNYSEDATAMAKEFREQAKVFSDIANSVPAEAQSEQFFTDFNYRQLVINKILREEND